MEYSYTIEYLCVDCHHTWGDSHEDDAYTLDEIIKEDLLSVIPDCPKCYLDKHVVISRVDLV